MREIKFRAWDSKHSKMSVDVSVYSNGRFKFMNAEDNDVLNEDGDVLMQFTGLKDKNGKEIYEGDIVQLIDDPALVPEQYWSQKYLVEFISSGYSCFCFGRSEVIYEIIGNIYENPELLK